MKRALLLAALSLGGCSGIQTAADPAAVQSGVTANLFVLFLAITGFFLLLVLLGLGWAVFRRRRDSDDPAALKPAITVWAGMIVLGLTILTLGSFFTDRHLAKAAAAPRPIRMRMMAQQWWWQVEYDDPTPSNIFRTANELHLPVNVPAVIELSSPDVIHSLWIPNLAGKQDLIPGRRTDIYLLPRRVGHYRAQCAEFCGLQHAHMALDVIVEPWPQFQAWRQQSVREAAPPATPQQKAGYNFFMTHQCMGCHAIAGTPAYGSVGPDLTHLASRATIAAGSFPNNRGYLEGWIANPQAMKPGTKMPAVTMSPDELHALAAYLESLK